MSLQNFVVGLWLNFLCAETGFDCPHPPPKKNTQNNLTQIYTTQKDLFSIYILHRLS